MRVSKENRILIYKGNKGKLDVYFNINGKQYRSTVFPNVNEDLEVRDWGGNVYENEEEL